MRQQGVFLLPPRRNASLLLGYPQDYLNIPLPIYTLGWKVALGEKCLYQQHNTMTGQKCCDAQELDPLTNGVGILESSVTF